MRIEIDRGRCIGSGDCVVTAGALFGQDHGGVVILVGQPSTDELVELAREAVENCPSGALNLVEDSG